MDFDGTKTLRTKILKQNVSVFGHLRAELQTFLQI